jgi:hypothetical protein
MITSSFAGSGDRDARRRGLPVPSLLRPCSADFPLQHVPQKWEPVLRKRTCSNKVRDDDSKKSHPALARVFLQIVHHARPLYRDLQGTLPHEVFTS